MTGIANTKRTGEQCVSVTLPELLQLENSARQLSLTALRFGRSQGGQNLSRFLGRGMEFAESRLYQSGDDIRNIDWRVTARTGKAHTKLFTVEKEREVLLCLDMRTPMHFATQGSFKSVQASLLSGYISWNTFQAGNRLGGMIFDDTSHVEFRPKLGKRGLLPLLQALAEKTTITKRPKSNTNSTTMTHAISGLTQVANPGSLIFVISDFRNLTQQAEDQLIQIARHCDLCLCFLFDPLEEMLPKNGFFPVTDGNAELQLNTFDKQNLLNYQNQFALRKDKVKALSSHRHIHFIECSTQEDCFEVLKQHFYK
ncbi:MAG: DUF58 domain-containing protein [Parachlamydiaceae bacterium]|nr:DUF58 domain-containing protein [Parachlamydiaceae bacterium]